MVRWYPLGLLDRFLQGLEWYSQDPTVDRITGIVGFGKRLLNVTRNLRGIRQNFNLISSPMLAASIYSLLRGRDFPDSDDKTSGCGTFVKKERE